MRLDSAIIAGTYNASVLGQYTLARELAAIPTTEIVAPMSRVLLPAYAKIISNPKELRDAYINVLSVLAIICASAAVGLAVVARDLVPVVLGPQWTDAADFMVWLALSSGMVGYSESVFLVITAAGYSKRVAILSWSRLLVTVPILLIAAQWSDATSFAVARCIMILILAPTYFFGLSMIIPITAGQVLAVTWRPVFAAAIMAAAVLGFRHLMLEALLPMARLAIELPFGATIFILALFSLWLAAGRPPGPERAGLRYLARHPVVESFRSVRYPQKPTPRS
jgi:O-antigen/teichoic acid export membrane protein